ncbi:hypothetical protein SERLA73DRAFT_176892 [Serpula lacrymans var. lacrymans S7.3]|uniref:Uncharacterized protein n=2 Tax=Serpula lacrymans var. lacrymans TaxID=341189 RepID=F8PQD6_SERL3|nr:uncharacterized protein SERLADRAFT_460200 [Serpula lacrymans var. lacrymans S7.9]EGO01549.1 hypothetical protein SERLA73DRAFT_176892 [Serpula lacrymans var. lacrymans S7.3]EGO27203.1 hypothetical protein SERLADRAFT_460200 [Serpula lacrymans var. lacrymans S7.9]
MNLGTNQQTALERQGLPTMLVTDSESDREKQQRVVQVLESTYRGRRRFIYVGYFRKGSRVAMSSPRIRSSVAVF